MATGDSTRPGPTPAPNKVEPRRPTTNPTT